MSTIRRKITTTTATILVADIDAETVKTKAITVTGKFASPVKLKKYLNELNKDSCINEVVLEVKEYHSELRTYLMSESKFCELAYCVDTNAASEFEQ